MAKNTEVETESAVETFDLTLPEFCTRLSGSDKRVELIAGFHSDEVANGVVKDSEESFTARFAAFAVRPV